MRDEAYKRYALEANRATTNLATFRAIAKKYPDKATEAILRDLVASTPGNEGKWFAAAKSAGLFDVAIELATHSPTDPRTFTRAARDFCDKQPDFALQSGLVALQWLARGHGYEMAAGDVFEAYLATIKAAQSTGVPTEHVKAQIRDRISGAQPGSQFAMNVLERYLP